MIANVYCKVCHHISEYNKIENGEKRKRPTNLLNRNYKNLTFTYIAQSVEAEPLPYVI